MGTPRFNAGSAASAGHATRLYFPLRTVKCHGPMTFRSQAARDLACLFDVDPGVRSWQAAPFEIGSRDHRPDFLAVREDGHRELADACDRPLLNSVCLLEGEALELGYSYRLYATSDIYDGHRLANAKDLLRYAGWNPGLDARLRLQAVLSEEGSLTVSECLRVLGERNAVGVLAALVLRGFAQMELDEGPIGPDTMVRRIGA